MNHPLFRLSLFLCLSVLISGCFWQKSVQEETVPTAPDVPTRVVKIVEFFDYGCPHCRDAVEVLDTMKEEYGNKIVVEHKHYPLSAKTFFVAQAAECARMQGSFLPFHRQMMGAHFAENTQESLTAVAQEIGLNTDEFETCLNSGITKTDVQEDFQEGRKRSIRGTPYFVINDSVTLPGLWPEDIFRSLIEREIEKISVESGIPAEEIQDEAEPDAEDGV